MIKHGIIAACGLAVGVILPPQRAMAQTTVPIIWAFQEPLGTAASDARITRMVRVYANQSGSDAAIDAAAGAALAPSGKVCILIQNYGNEAGYCNLSYHASDKVAGPIYNGGTDVSAWTLWTSYGRSEASAWMDDFIDEYKNQSGATPNRFHFDSEGQLVGCCNKAFLEVFDEMQMDGRWSGERLPGFGDTLDSIYAVASQWENPLASPATLPYNSGYHMGDAGVGYDNKPFSRWYIGVGLQTLDAAMNEAAYSPIKTQWPSCKTSNYESSCSFDGVSGRYYQNPWGTSGTLFIPGLKWEGSADFQSPYFYNVSADYHSGTESVWDTSMRINLMNLEAMIDSGTGGNSDDIVPWVPVVNQKITTDGTAHNVSELDVRRLLALLRSRDIGEFIAFNNDPGGSSPDTDCSDDLSWTLFAKVVDGVWGATVSGASVVQGSTGQSPQAPITLALGDPLNVTAAMVGASDYRATIEVTYTSDFDTAPCKLAAILEGTASGGASVTAAIEFYNYSTLSWDSAGTDPGFQGVPNQMWRVISATNHIDSASGHEIKARVKYTSTASFTVAADCLQVIAHAVEYVVGDANGDGVCNTTDLLLSMAYATPVCKGTNGDVNNDGAVNAYDQILVTSYLGLNAPVCP